MAVGSLDYSAAIYVVLSTIAMGVFIVRRNFTVFGNAELGGPMKPKILCGIFLISLWILYVVLSSLRAYNIIPGF